MATTVKITETYDLKTEIGKLGLIGIHTPSDNLLRKLYPGLMKNHRFVRFLKCDIVGACASVLPADPLQVGVEAGDIAPEDLFNPILMRPCSNESFDLLQARIYNAPTPGGLGSVSKADGMPAISGFNDYDIYYSLLAESKRWKKAMPQKGFAMRGLYPLMHTLLSSFGNTVKPGNFPVESPTGDETTETRYVPNVADVGEMAGNGTVSSVGDAVVMRGKAVKMPKLPLHYGIEGTDSPSTINIPKTFVACILTPPARLHSFYYRMRCTWTIRFENVIPTTEPGAYQLYKDVAGMSYKGYTYSSSKSMLDNESDIVDTNDVTLNKIMES